MPGTMLFNGWDDELRRAIERSRRLSQDPRIAELIRLAPNSETARRTLAELGIVY
jgi:hypothetical protein